MKHTGTYGDYFERLTALLRERGLPEARIGTLTRELRTYAEEAGGDVTEEFGPVAELAEQLCEREAAGLSDGRSASGSASASASASATSSAPDDKAETWVWTADALKERRLLEQFGGQGWEVERLDRLGRFVCRRDLEHPMRWEYRRETVRSAQRAQRNSQLGPEGWELCGVWGPLAYYKRPGAVLDGPAARLSEPLAPPRRRTYIGKWLYVVIAAWVLAVVAAVSWGVGRSDLSDPSTLAGLCVGLAVAGAMGAAAAWALRRWVEGQPTPDGE